MSNSSSSIWGHLVHFAKFRNTFNKLPLPQFLPEKLTLQAVLLVFVTPCDFTRRDDTAFSTKLYGKYGNQEGNTACHVLGVLSNLNVI